MKKIQLTFILILLFLATLLTSCTDNDSACIYKSENVSVAEVDSLSNKQYASYEWIPLTEESMYTRNTIAITGVVKNFREVTVTYTHEGLERTEYVTLFDFELNKIIFSNTDVSPQKGTLTIGHSITSYDYSEGIPVLEEGKEFLLFCIACQDQENDPMEHRGYADYWVIRPNDLMIEKADGFYIVSDFFQQYLGEEDIMKQALDLSAEQCAAFSNHPLSDLEQLAKTYGKENNINTLYALREQTQTRSSTFEEMVASYSIVDPELLEDIISSTAEKYK